MGSVIVFTLSKAFTKVVYNTAGHFMWNGSNFLTNCTFKLFNRLRAITVYLWLEVSPEKKKSHGFKSDERAAQPMSLRNEIKWPGNISLKIPKARREVYCMKKMALYVLFENKNTFLFLYFICLLLNLQMCQIILPDPVYMGNWTIRILRNDLRIVQTTNLRINSRFSSR